MWVLILYHPCINGISIVNKWYSQIVYMTLLLKHTDIGFIPHWTNKHYYNSRYTFIPWFELRSQLKKYKDISESLMLVKVCQDWKYNSYRQNNYNGLLFTNRKIRIQCTDWDSYKSNFKKRWSTLIYTVINRWVFIIIHLIYIQCFILVLYCWKS